MTQVEMTRAGLPATERDPERGAALMAAALVLVVLLGASAVFLMVGQSRFVGSTEIVTATEATLFAESAVALRAYEINSGKVAQTDLQSNTVPGRVLKAGDRTATVFTDSRGYPKRVFLGATARTREGRAGIEVMLTRRITPLFGYGLGAKQGMQIQSNVVIDSYNSNYGSYTQTAAMNGDIGSEAGTVQIQGNVEIRGDASIGGTIDMKADSTITGELVTDDPPTFPLVDAEIEAVHATVSSTNDNDRLRQAIQAAGSGWELDSSGVLKTTSSNPPPLNIPPGSYWLRGVQAQQQAQINFTGPGETVLAVDGDIQLKQQSFFSIAPGTVVKTYIKGNMEVQQQAEIDPLNLVRPTEQFQVYGHSDGGTLQIQQGGAIFGAFYWPGGDVQVQQNVTLFGSLIGEKVQVQSNVFLHYDEGINVGIEGSFGVYGYRKTAQD